MNASFFLRSFTYLLLPLTLTIRGWVYTATIDVGHLCASVRLSISCFYVHILFLLLRIVRQASLPDGRFMWCPSIGLLLEVAAQALPQYMKPSGRSGEADDNQCGDVDGLGEEDDVEGKVGGVATHESARERHRMRAAQLLMEG